MPSTLALNPELNVRVFTAGARASLEAAEAWMGNHHAEEMRAYNVLVDVQSRANIEVLPHAGVEARCLVYWEGTRYRFSGTPDQLHLLGSRLIRRGQPVLGGELHAAVSGFEAALNPTHPTLVMGILNVTPDSFSDGGQWLDPGAAADHALQMVEDGAHVIDIGGESTRPGATEVPADEELRRVLPVLERLRPQTRALLSIDTRKAAVARPCLSAGADWINDVSGLTHDPSLARVAAAYPACRLVLMHSRAKPDDERYSTEYDAQGRPVYEDVVADTLRWLRRQANVALEAGVAPEQLWIDPGFGFGKTFDQNVELLRRLREYTSAGMPVLVGTSRKSSVGRLVSGLPPEERLEGTAATVAWAIAQGAAAVRVHDVREMARVARATDALR